MAIFTVFHEHPDHGKGSYTTFCTTARLASDEAKDMLPDRYATDPKDKRELDKILAKLSIKVYAGRVREQPATRPLASVTPKS